MSLKILYISPENTAGTLSIWKKAHEENGHYCRYITFYPSSVGFTDDIVLNLPLVSSSNLYIKFRWFLQNYFYNRDPLIEKSEQYPKWKPINFLEKFWFIFRDFIGKYKIESLIIKYELDKFDIIHFEWGMDFYRDCRFAIKMKNKRKKIICHYHGPDLRTRGVISPLNEITDINLTNEVDLLMRHPNINYIFLPFNTKKYKQKKKINTPIILFHSTMNRYYKGSQIIIETCKKLENKYNIKFILMEKESNEKVLHMKQNCDINIDQISNTGGWGYGMNSIESLSMGICTATNMNTEMKNFLPDHPFYEITKENLFIELENLIKQPKKIMEFGIRGKKWVEKKHDYKYVIKSLYKIYESKNII